MDKLFVMANPKYGSEKKGAPTNYYLTVAPRAHQGELRAEPRGRGAVLRSEGVHAHQSARRPEARAAASCGNRATRPRPRGSAFPRSIGSSSATTTSASSSCPASTSRARRRTSRICSCACRAIRFLGAFFRVSPVPEALRHHRGACSSTTCSKQYEKKFGRFGDAVVTSNMTVMTEGFSRVQEIKYGELDDPDRSLMRNPPLAPLGEHEIIPTAGCGACGCGGIPTAGGADAARAVPDAGEVRHRVPQRTRLSPARRRARVGRRDGRRHAAPRSPSMSRAARRRFTSPRIARSAWSASRPAPTPRCPTRRRM